MDTQPQDDLLPPIPDGSSLSRRGFLRSATLAGGGLLAAGLAACTTDIAPSWTYGPTATSQPSASAGASAGASPAASAAASAAPSADASHAASPDASHAPPSGEVPTGWTAHDIAARNVVRRFVGDLAPALQGIYGDAAFAKLVDILGAAEDYPELHAKPAFAQVPQLVLNDLLQPLTPTLDGNVKVFDLTIDEYQHRIDELKEPIQALGYNGQWPGPTIRVTQGDTVRARFTNNLTETTGVHFHGVMFDDFFQDGVPFITQKPIVPGETYTYEFVARNAGSHMYHSHHNASDQVGRGLLGAFLVEPAEDAPTYDRDYVWISNDTHGGFTINGHGFPAVVPVLAAVGEKVLVRFMNEGIMMHPWHSHGYTMDVVARDGVPLGTAAFGCDTLGVNPGERFDAVITAERPGLWAFHCHILPHVEGPDGMFGMVTALIVVPDKADVDTIVGALTA
jgi:FtsP/CotA-like multicopper oxidase with cupredoxin domain